MLETPSTLTILREARELVARGWCQGSPAVTATGDYTGAKAPSARRWCAVGAISAATDSTREMREPLLLLGQALASPWPDLTFWNDMPGRTQAEVLAAFDAAIARLENSHAR